MQSVVRQQDYHVDTGILGTRYILDVLTEAGQGEAAYRMATHRSYPGWGYMLAEGATTLWERWEKLTGHAMNSQNHIMLGSIDAWFYRVLAGLSPLAPGWKGVRVRPHLLGDLTAVEARLETVAGAVGASWRKTGRRARARGRHPRRGRRRGPRPPPRAGRADHGVGTGRLAGGPRGRSRPGGRSGR